MKNLFYLSLLFLGLSFAPQAQAQVSVNINIGNQPLWGPAGHEYARFYYLPEIDVYYNIASRKYTYFHGNRWVTKSKLPARYRKFDLYRTYKVVINDHNPWAFHERNRRAYGRHAHNHTQVVIRDAGRRPQHPGIGQRPTQRPGNGPDKGRYDARSDRNSKSHKDHKNSERHHGRH